MKPTIYLTNDDDCPCCFGWGTVSTDRVALDRDGREIPEEEYEQFLLDHPGEVDYEPTGYEPCSQCGWS